MPWPQVPAELVDTYKACTSLQDLETYSELYFAFHALGRYSYVPAPKIKRSWITGAKFLEFIPMLRGLSPIRVPLDAWRDLRVTDVRFKAPAGPIDA